MTATALQLEVDVNESGAQTCYELRSTTAMLLSNHGSTPMPVGVDLVAAAPQWVSVRRHNGVREETCNQRMKEWLREVTGCEILLVTEAPSVDALTGHNID